MGAPCGAGPGAGIEPAFQCPKLFVFAMSEREAPQRSPESQPAVSL